MATEKQNSTAETEAKLSDEIFKFTVYTPASPIEYANKVSLEYLDSGSFIYCGKHLFHLDKVDRLAALLRHGCTHIGHMYMIAFKADDLISFKDDGNSIFIPVSSMYQAISDFCMWYASEVRLDPDTLVSIFKKGKDGLYMGCYVPTEVKKKVTKIGLGDIAAVYSNAPVITDNVFQNLMNLTKQSVVGGK